MRIAAIAGSITLAAFLLHLLAWRIHLPKRQTAALLWIFTITLLCGWVVCSLPASRAAGWGLDGPWQYAHVGIFHIAMMLGYIVAYSAIEARSPSMMILTTVADTKAAGIARHDIERMLSATSPLTDRTAAMLRDRMITHVGEQYELTPKGRSWAVVFSAWSRLLAIGKGG